MSRDEKKNQINTQFEKRFPCPDGIDGQTTEILNASQEKEQCPGQVEPRPPNSQHPVLHAVDRPENEGDKGQNAQGRPRPGLHGAESERSRQQSSKQQGLRSEGPSGHSGTG